MDVEAVIADCQRQIAENEAATAAADARYEKWLAAHRRAIQAMTDAMTAGFRQLETEIRIRRGLR